MLKKLKANWPKYKNILSFYLTSYLDKFIYLLGKGRKAPANTSNGLKTVLFVTEDPRIDIIRFFKAVKKEKGLNYLLLINHSKLDHLFEEVGFDQVIYFRNHWDFRNKLNQLKNIDLVHGFTRRCYVTEILIKEYNWPVVISAKDTSLASHGLNPPHWYLKKELPSERFSFENANGLIAESLELCHATKLFKIKKASRRMYFPNYCERIGKSSMTEPTDFSNGIHLVYVGSIRGSQDDPAEHGNIQMHWLINTLNDQGIYFHIYPNPNMTRAVYDEYFKMSEELPYFTMHESLNPEQMSQEISKYHFGLIPFFNEDTKRSTNKRYYSSSLKIFNYIESGLPLLISEDMGHQRWIMERYGMAIAMQKSDFFNLNNKLGNISYQEMKENLLKKREKITLENQIERVIEFYEMVVNEFKLN